MKKYYRPRAQQKTVLLFKILRVIWNQPYRIGIYSEISINSFTFFHTTPACRPEQIFSRRGLFIKSLVESCSLGGGGGWGSEKGGGGQQKVRGWVQTLRLWPTGRRPGPSDCAAWNSDCSPATCTLCSVHRRAPGLRKFPQASTQYNKKLWNLQGPRWAAGRPPLRLSLDPSLRKLDPRSSHSARSQVRNNRPRPLDRQEPQSRQAPASASAHQFAGETAAPPPPPPPPLPLPLPFPLQGRPRGRLGGRYAGHQSLAYLGSDKWSEGRGQVGAADRGGAAALLWLYAGPAPVMLEGSFIMSVRTNQRAGAWPTMQDLGWAEEEPGARRNCSVLAL